VEEETATAIPVGPSPEPEPLTEAVASPEDAAEPIPEPEPIATAAVAIPLNGGAEHEVDDDEADPQDMRRHIANASQSFDPDHQIRRAMDAFLSPLGPERERRTPDA
jgi:hypothetical protein